MLLQSISNGGLVLSHSSHSLIHPKPLFLPYKGAYAFHCQGDEVWHGREENCIKAPSRPMSYLGAHIQFQFG